MKHPTAGAPSPPLEDQVPPTAAKRPSIIVIGALVSVYFIWGSTYLGLRIGLEGFPPLILNGLRFLVAGSVLYVTLRVRGRRQPGRRQTLNAAGVGLILLIGGVGLVTFAENAGVGSGIAATAVAVMPVWAALIGGFFGVWPKRIEWLGLGVGLIGVIVLVQEGDFRASPIGMGLMIVSPMIWAFGSVVASRLDLPGPFMTAALQLLAAGAVMTVAGLAIGERITAAPSPASWLALLYLSVFGSLIAYTSYLYLLGTVRPSLATSYAYVNPVVAVALGLTVGNELITGPVFIALPLILLGIGLVASANRRSRPQAEGAPTSNEPVTNDVAA